jgi:hypothetical protein
MVERIDAAIKRITSGQAPMRIPVDQTDPDIVLADCRSLIERMAKKRKVREATDWLPLPPKGST